MSKRPTFTFRLVTFAFAALVGIGAGVPVTLQADDTEIYLGDDSLAEATRSNVLFILDTSGSMGSKDGGSTTRIDRMKVALKGLLESINNVNVGLMRFTVPGGPVLYPVSYIEASDAEIITGGVPEVSTSINSSADDAEERQCTESIFGSCSSFVAGVGTVVLDSPKLELAEVAGEDGTPIDVQINSSDDDAEESPTVPFSNNNSNQLELGEQNRIAGLRFNNVPLPSNANITAAYLDFYSRSTQTGATTLVVRGHDANPTNAFPNAIDHIGSTTSPWWRWDQYETTASASVDVGPWASGDRYQVPGLESVVQEIVDRPDWDSGEDITLLVGGSGKRDAASYDDQPWRAPILHVEYTTGDPGRQLVALRFNNINVPQGVSIKSAYLEFTPAENTDEDMDVTIRAQAIGNAPPLTAADKDISGRTLTSSKEDWSQNSGDDWFVDSPVLSKDIKSVVEEVVKRSDWCGGNSMVFVLEYKDKQSRTVYSFDGDSSKAPRLVIDYDQGSLASLGSGEGCMVQEIQAQIKSSRDDAEQRTDNGSFSSGGNTLEMTNLGNGKVQDVGLRFRDLAIKPNAKILSATIEFTARDSDSQDTDLTFWGHKVDDADDFRDQNDRDVISRNRTTASVPWDNIPSWTKDNTYISPDLSAIVQEIVDYDWSEGNDMAFIIGGTGQRNAYTVDKNAGKAATLRIRLQGTIGSDTVSETVTVRQRLLDIVDELPAKDGTPIVDTLYEAALYYRGERMEYGDTRNKKSHARISHSASYTGGTVYWPSGCDEENLDDKDCKDQRIDGEPVYISPIEPQLCQSNFIVLLSDGQANNNNSHDEVQKMIGVANCDNKFSNGDNVGGGEKCGVDLARWLQTEDQSDVEGKNVVTTYTIGFNFTSQFLKDIAAGGGGEFYEASSADQLTSVFNSILDDVQARTTSFATPALSVNAFNKLFHRNEVYFSLFTPGRDVRWEGNVKKYQLCKSSADGCTLGEVLDSRDPPLPAIGGDERIDDNALSFWTTTPDGPAILEGGAGNHVPAHSARRIFTYTDSAAPVSVDLGNADHLVKDSNAKITIPMLGGSTDTASPAYMTSAQRDDLINWIRGQDVRDEDVDGDDTDDRYSFTDPLHSSPVAVTYGGTEANPVIKLFVGTNDGALRMINGVNGKEEWTFIPQIMLGAQRTLMTNPIGKHVYGIDGTPTLWVNDENLDGIIDPTVDVNGDGRYEFVRIYVGMRRGGKNYYAIDATPAGGPLTDPDVINGVTPKLLWRIEGDSGDYPALGETWSQPKLATIKVGTDTAGIAVYKKVLVFAGGYSDAQDSGFGPGGPGNAIYIADPDTGKRLFWVSSDDHGDNQGVVVSKMGYPIPSDLALTDSDGDGAVDRIYVGDTGGQLWRVDIGPLLTDTAGFKATVGMLATVSDPAELADQRKFFYPPDVVRVVDTTYSSVGKYDLVTIASGNRAHPLNADVQDRFYAFRDVHYGALVDGDPADPSDDDGLADGYTTLQGKTVAITPGDLFDVTDINDPQGTDLTDLQNAKGYFIDLEGYGEKGLSSPVILAGTVFFTSYTPEDVLQLADCSLAEGGGVLYAFNVLNGAAAFNWDGIGDDTNLTKGDRTYTLGAGIPSSAVPIFQPEGITLLVGGGGGATTIDPDLDLPRFKTYWSHE